MSSGAATLEKISYKELKHWGESGNARTRLPGFTAFQKSCKQILSGKQPPQFKGQERSLAEWRKPCAKALSMRLAALAENDIREFFEAYFEPYHVVEGKTTDAFFTGYFEMEIKGSRTKHGSYIYPVYGKPKDMKDGVPYLTRAEINRGALEGKGLAIAYTDDPVRLFFLQVQGSGRITLDDGTSMHLGFAAKNLRPYVSIGKYLKDSGKLKGNFITANDVMNWLRANTKVARAVMEKNQSYVFFKETGTDGPYGAAGVALTPEGSLAVDPSTTPLGTPVWVDTEVRWGEKTADKFYRLMTAQDTGTAIVGPLRGDIFFGYGPSAESAAGRTQSKGTLYVLLPKASKGHE